MKNPFSLPAKRVALALAIFVFRPTIGRRLQADRQIGAEGKLPQWSGGVNEAEAADRGGQNPCVTTTPFAVTISS
jgi:hypothetical protein